MSLLGSAVNLDARYFKEKHTFLTKYDSFSLTVNNENETDMQKLQIWLKVN